MTQYVYFFGDGKAEGKGVSKEVLGGKGAGLAEMTSIGIPVPAGFTITTEACDAYFKGGNQWPGGLNEQVDANVKKIEASMGHGFGSADKPLLVSVRSGAAISMPGMMDTILNLGLSDAAAEALAKATNNARMAYDSYRRLIEMFGGVVMGVDRKHFEHRMDELKARVGAQSDVELNADHLKELAGDYKAIYEKAVGKPFPQDAREQLKLAVEAVFKSWNNDRAKAYRAKNRVTGLKGTGVNVQAMVFGNWGDTSGTGVGFTRNPANGHKEFMAEYLFNAQGEDVVAGIRTPVHLNDLKARQPEVYEQILTTFTTLEQHYKDMQDTEFTVQDGKLFFLQTRTGKRTAFAAIKIACDMVDEKLITPEDAIRRLPADDMPQLFAPVFDGDKLQEARDGGRLLASGLAAGPGAATGHIVFTPAAAVQWLKGMKDKPEDGKAPVILLRRETSPEDISGMYASKGILTSRGGQTSHAAVVARGEGIPCVVGCGDLNINEEAATVTVGGKTLKSGDWVSINGMTGEVFDGEIPTRPSEIQQVLEGRMKADDSEVYQQYTRIMGWADEIRKLGVRTNSDTPDNCRMARLYGAEGIGLCRTEHMFFGKDRIMAVREMILADNDADREKALYKVKPFQKQDFTGIFEVMDGLPCTIRLLDPPLHEFLPNEPELQAELANDIGKPVDYVINRVAALHEANPMLGHRGCRLGVTFPQIYNMQVEAIIEAAIDVTKAGKKVLPEIMIPLIATAAELEILRKRTVDIAERLIKASGVSLPYLVGTMIEIPRAALTADDVAHHADFFSFGTNDLTQCTFGLSRDDSWHFMPQYMDQAIFPTDPFAVLDVSGVGQLVDMACQKGLTPRHQQPRRHHPRNPRDRSTPLALLFPTTRSANGAPRLFVARPCIDPLVERRIRIRVTPIADAGRLAHTFDRRHDCRRVVAPFNTAHRIVVFAHAAAIAGQLRVGRAHQLPHPRQVVGRRQHALRPVEPHAAYLEPVRRILPGGMINRRQHLELRQVIRIAGRALPVQRANPLPQQALATVRIAPVVPQHGRVKLLQILLRVHVVALAPLVAVRLRARRAFQPRAIVGQRNPAAQRVRQFHHRSRAARPRNGSAGAKWANHPASV